MRQTLFVIPHEFLATWALPVWCVLVLLAVVWQYLRHGASKDLWGWLWLGLGGLAVIRFVLPAVEIMGFTPESPETPVPLGIAIRGWGAMFLAALVAGVGISAQRARRMGVDVETLMSLAFWVVLFGVIGARAFYVIEYREDFQADSLGEWLGRVANTTQGGMVVYGSLIGGLGATLVFCWRHRLPMLATADLIMPGMLLGLALGRVGCLMNGCCYGGECDWPIAVTFPQESPPYLEQAGMGRLVGIRSRPIEADPSQGEAGDDWREVMEVMENSPASRAGLQVGDRFLPDRLGAERMEAAEVRQDRALALVLRFENRPPLEVPLLDLPRRSVPIHPTQVYAAIGAVLLCLVLWFGYPFRYGDGEVLGWALALYAGVRYLEEVIRVDEAGQFGTGLSISQLTSLALLPLGLALIGWARRGKTGSAFPPEGAGWGTEQLRSPEVGV